MSLLKPIKGGRMYEGWWRWNPIPGCLHGCSYCYMKAMSKRTGKDIMMTPTGLREEYLNDNLGSGRQIFVCSSGDMWGKWVQKKDIAAVLETCFAYQDNEYMFLTKNPDGYWDRGDVFYNINCILGATIETDADALGAWASDAPSVLSRLGSMEAIRERFDNSRTMISIEPVMPFTERFAERLGTVGPDIVYIGRDTGHNGLPEPTDDELRRLVTELRNADITVHLKKSLDGLMEG